MRLISLEVANLAGPLKSPSQNQFSLMHLRCCQRSLGREVEFLRLLCLRYYDARMHVADGAMDHSTRYTIPNSVNHTY